MAPVKADRSQRIAAVGYNYTSKPKKRVVSCNLCGGTEFVGLTHRDRYGFPAQAVLCARCGLVFLNPVMTAPAYREFYDTMYRPLVSAYHGRRIDVETMQKEQNLYAREVAEFLSPTLEGYRPRTLLDIGGSTGVVAHSLARRFNLGATVLDPAPLEIHAAARRGLYTITGFAEEFDPSGRSFDLVTMCQTIDHLLDIQAALDRARKVMPPTGLFFVDIVDFRSAYLRAWDVESATKIDHPYYLTEATAEAYLRRNGFGVIGKECASDRLHVRYICRVDKADSGYLPPFAGVEALLREVRYVQCARKSPQR